MEVLYLFMMFSIVGWLWETPWVSIRMKKFINRGVLRGPYIPIYGCAVVSIILTMGVFDGMEGGLLLEVVKIIYMALVTAVWEFVTSYVLEKMFKTRWWDYSTHKYNIQGRVSLGVTAFFGIGGYILYEFVLPLFSQLYLSTQAGTMTLVLIVFYIIFTVDSVITTIELFKTKQIITQIESLSKELATKLDVKWQEGKLQLRETRVEFETYLNEIKTELVTRYKEFTERRETTSMKDRLKQFSDKLEISIKNNRFFKKYPASISTPIENIHNFLNSLKDKLKK